MTLPTLTSSFFDLALAGARAKDRFTACVLAEDGARLAEHSFDWRVDSVELNLNLGELARQARTPTPPENDLARGLGERMYRAVFGGAVGKLWDERREQATRDEPLALRLSVEPKGARPLLRLPWEYLHDGANYLALDRRTPLVRLPWGVKPHARKPLKEALRLLVVIAAPHDLGENEVLNFALEEDILLAATAAARREGRVQVEFAAGGSIKSIATALDEFDPHILHFTGHGVFIEKGDDEKGEMSGGYLLLEDERGEKRLVSHQEFAATLEQQARSLRMVFLSACQSAIAPRTEGFPDLGSYLLSKGFPAALAMQHSVFNRAAIAFAGAFYQAAARGDALHEAAAAGRGALHLGSPNRIDFATPVLFLADPGALRVDENAARAAADIPRDLGGVTVAAHFAGRAVELRKLQSGLDPQHGAWRAAVIYGMGGMGKTVLAARLAERMASRLRGVIALRMTPTSRAGEVLERIAAFLLAHNGDYNLPAIVQFNQAVRGEGVPLETKAGLLAGILTRLPLLLIFDNCEDILHEGEAVSREMQKAGEAKETKVTKADPDLLRLIEMLVGGVKGPARFLFTSRVDFDPVEANRLGGEIGHLDLGEMRFREAVYMMENLPPLNELPISESVMRRVVMAGNGAKDEEGGAPPVRPITQRRLYERLGGHPYRLNLFAEHAKRRGVQAVLDDLADVDKKMLEFTLLERAVASLPERAARLLRRAAIYDQAVPLEGLAYMLGDERDAMPEVSAEAAALRAWGLLACPPGDDEEYAVHALVRDWAREGMAEEERLALLRRAADYWHALGQDSGNLAHHLSARHYWFLAGDYERADQVVNAATEPLLRWGQIGLLLELLGESIATLQGQRRAIARGNLATVYQGLGAVDEARRIYEQVLAEFHALNARPQIATSLHQLGILHQDQGEYAAARQRYEQSLAIKQELGNRAGISITLHQLGMLHQAQGEYAAARERYEQSLAIEQELGNRAGIAGSLGQLGDLDQAQGEYAAARERCEQAGAIFQELGARREQAAVLHQLGMLYQAQGEYAAARERYEQSLAMAQELGDRAGIAQTLHNLGALHQAQNEYAAARERYEQSLAIKQELVDRAGIAATVSQLGILLQQQGEYAQARQMQEQSLAIRQEIGDRAGMAICLHQLGRLLEEEGQFATAVPPAAQALSILTALGAPDRRIAGRTLERLRQNLGDAAFEQALRDGGIDPAQLQALLQAAAPPEEGQGMTLEQMVNAIVNNTIAVLTTAAAQKGQWRQAVAQLHAQLASPEALPEMADLAAFVGAVQGLLDGGEPTTLTSGVPQAFRPPWQAILDGMVGGASPPPPPPTPAAPPADPPGEPAAPEGEEEEAEMTLEQFLDHVTQVTITVMTAQPEKKEEWWKALNEFYSQARRHADNDRAAFFDVLRRMLEGARPARLTESVPEAYGGYWQKIVGRLERYNV